MWRWSNNYILQGVIKGYLNQAITLLNTNLKNKFSFMGINAEINAFDPPVINPTYLDLDLEVQFSKQLKLFLQRFTYPNRGRLNDVPDPSEAVVIN